MKKLLLLALPFLLLSCSSNSKKIISSVSDEIGTSGETKTFNDKETYVKWKIVSIGKSEVIKNAVDKSFGSLPTKTVDLSQSFDQNANAIPGEFNKYWVYENSSLKVELDYTYNGYDKNNMLVELHVTTK